MIDPALLRTLFQESCSQIWDATEGISHAASTEIPAWGGNSVHWTVGHVVVARCNFLQLLGVPSIWDWATCKLFIPGSSPTLETNEYIDFSSLRLDLGRTQDQLLRALENLSEKEMGVVKDGLTIGEHLASYATHESFHAGQLEILRRWLQE